jgi:hypothetical protein
MAEVVRADELAVGDVYAERSTLKRIAAIRFYYAGHRRVEIEFTNIASLTMGDVSMTDWSTVLRVREISTDQALLLVSDLQPSEHITLWRRLDGGFYA